jgi:hypothetical protein
MRTISLASGIIAIGVIAALPFRRTEKPVDPNAPVGIATGPLGQHLHDQSISSVTQWPERPGFDPSLAWQPQPMRLEANTYAFEMPEMPESYPYDSIEVPMPAPVRERFDAVVHTQKKVSPDHDPAPAVVMPPNVPTEDRFQFTPAAVPAPKANASIHSASVIRHDEASRESSAPRQYIREPH